MAKWLQSRPHTDVQQLWGLMWGEGTAQRISFKFTLGGKKETSILCKDSLWGPGHPHWGWALPARGKELAVGLLPCRNTASTSPPSVSLGTLHL